MLVRKYECPNCGYSKVPTTHRGCSGSEGIIVKKEGSWVCNDCGKSISTGIKCPECGTSVPTSNITTIDSSLIDISDL